MTGSAQPVIARRFQDKVALITGGSTGLGLATAHRIATEGGAVVITARSENVLKGAVAEVEAAVPGARVEGIPGDVSVPDDVESLVAQVVAEFGRIDALFNNAGIDGPTRTVEDYGLADFDAVMSINLRGAFHVLASTLKVMREQGSGSVVNCTSVLGSHALGLFSGYGATKAGLEALTRSSALEYGQFGVRVNAVAPGSIWTPMLVEVLRASDPQDPEGAAEKFIQVNPSRRYGQASEVASVVAFLLSDDASFVNGTVTAIDGGQSVQY